MPHPVNSQLIQIPGALDIKMVKGDDLTFNVDFNMDLTGYTFASAVVFDNDTEVEITVTPADLPNGIIILTLLSDDTDSFAIGEQSWYLSWTTPSPSLLVRKVLAGKFTVIEGG